MSTPLVRKPDGKHTLPVDYPILTLAQMRALDQAVVAADAAVADCRQRREAVDAKRVALVERLAQMPEGPAADIAALEVNLADTLANDPMATLATGDLSAATEKRVEMRRAHEARAIERDAISQAIAKVDAEIAALDDEATRLQDARVARWREFLAAAHPFLIDRFRKAMAQLVTDSLQAAIDLQGVEIGGKRLVPYTAWKLALDSSIILQRNVPYERWLDNRAEPDTGSDLERDRLIEYDYAPAIGTRSEAIDRFRASLSR